MLDFHPPIFQNKTVVIIASGPSLNDNQLNHVRKRLKERPESLAVIAINNTYERAEWATDLYACDLHWWRAYKPTFTGRRWSQDYDARKYGATVVPSRAGTTLSIDPGYIRHGGNSSFQACNMAYILGAKRIVMLGLDLQPTNGKSHWHGDHPKIDRLTNPHAGTYRHWLNSFNNAHRQFEALGFDHVNATHSTALTSWPRMKIQEALKDANLDGNQ